MSNELVWPTANYVPPPAEERILNALHSGGYASFIPGIIESPFRDLNPAPPMAGFPISVCFTGLPQEGDREQAALYVVSSYWFDAKTYHEDDEHRAMTYYPSRPSSYKVMIRHLKKENRLEGLKLRDDKIIVDACGIRLDRFMIQLTLAGIDPGETVEPMLTRRDTASAGVWIYNPDFGRKRKVQ